MAILQEGGQVRLSSGCNQYIGLCDMHAQFTVETLRHVDPETIVKSSENFYKWIMLK